MSNLEASQYFEKPLPSGRIVEPSLEHYRFDPSRLEPIADAILHSLKITPKSRVLLNFQPGAAQLAEIVAFRVGKTGASLRIRAEDQKVVAAALAGQGQEAVDAIVGDLEKHVKWATQIIPLTADIPTAYDIVPDDVLKAFRDASSARVGRRVAKKGWVKVTLPTPVEAAKEGMSFEEYAEIVLNASRRDWNAVEGIQQIAIDEYLNPADKLEIIAGNDTHLTMSIKGQTFANNTTQHNIPGSEFFSSPVDGTINGTLVIPHPTLLLRSREIPNATFEFKDGKVVGYKVDSDDPAHTELLGQVLATDEGASRVGEIAFGTGLIDLPLKNTALREKGRGSFHIALGYCYPYKRYAGRKVRVQNGVESGVHNDFTRFLTPQYGGGQVNVHIPGRGWITIQENGKFTDERLADLNAA